MLYDEKDPGKFTGLWIDIKDAFENTISAECITDSETKALGCWAVNPANNEKREFKTVEAWNEFTSLNYLSH